MDQIENIDGYQYSIDGTKLAIVGMAGRFPGAKNITEFWENLKAGVESISFFTDEEVLATGVKPKLVKDPHYVKAGGVLEDVDQFDAEFFGFYPQEAVASTGELWI
jgi:acyl transferase domain-containing protein